MPYVVRKEDFSEFCVRYEFAKGIRRIEFCETCPEVLCEFFTQRDFFKQGIQTVNSLRWNFFESENALKQFDPIFDFLRAHCARMQADF